MKYTVDYLEDKKIVDIKMSGRLNFQIAEKYSREALKLARERECTKFLFDHRETTLNSLTNTHTSGDEFQQFGFKNNHRIAILGGTRNGGSKTAEPELRNSSWSVIKYFHAKKVDEAIDWLINAERKVHDY